MSVVLLSQAAKSVCHTANQSAKHQVDKFGDRTTVRSQFINQLDTLKRRLYRQSTEHKQKLPYRPSANFVSAEQYW